ncbi:hypothetical protein [Olleya aquimaris]|uniref:Uncharacterized protein n=1 Tax=Olleya aquimaris TaxID=639310 RepID=A0A327RIB5_9FLAO|nr:hypothetical protein [Olleya aquimaris]RAJ13427.1 hypothetical protein LY08_01944 [Olleya aquimaris]
MSKKTILYLIITVIAVLSIPLIAMQFTNDVNWSVFDFVIAGILLFSLGLITTYLVKTIKNPKIKIGIIVVLIILFLLIWAELAVGIFNSPFAGS